MTSKNFNFQKKKLHRSFRWQLLACSKRKGKSVRAEHSAHVCVSLRRWRRRQAAQSGSRGANGGCCDAGRGEGDPQGGLRVGAGGLAHVAQRGDTVLVLLRSFPCRRRPLPPAKYHGASRCSSGVGASGHGPEVGRLRALRPDLRLCDICDPSKVDVKVKVALRRLVAAEAERAPASSVVLDSNRELKHEEKLCIQEL